MSIPHWFTWHVCRKNNHWYWMIGNKTNILHELKGLIFRLFIIASIIKLPFPKGMINWLSHIVPLPISCGEGRKIVKRKHSFNKTYKPIKIHSSLKESSPELFLYNFCTTKNSNLDFSY